MAKKRGPGEGSIYKRKNGSGNSKWTASIVTGYDVDNGRPKRKTFYGATRGEVVGKLNEILPAVKNGTFNELSKKPFADWLDIWLNEYMKPSLRPTTWQGYEVQIRKHIKPALGHIKFNQLQTFQLQKLYNQKLESGRSDGKEGGLSARSVRYIHVVIHGALDQALKEGMISRNPANAVKLPKHEKKDIQYLTTEEVKIFLKVAKETKYFSLYLLEIATGLRRGELLGLRWDDIDLTVGKITVNQSLVRIKGGLAFQNPKTKLANRTISIPLNVNAEIKTHKKQQNIEKLAAGKAYEDGRLVFCNEIGRPLDPRGITRHFERLLKKAELPRITFHGLGHTFATMSLQEGIDIRTTQEILGHFDPAFTLSTYSGVTEKMKSRATEKIGNLLTPFIN